MRVLTLNVFICSWACAIELQDTVVVTGGIRVEISEDEYYYIGTATVQVYTISGPHEQLPDLLTARYGHGCAYFVDSKDRVVSI